VDISWKDGELVEATIHAGERAINKVRVVYGSKSTELSIKPDETVSLNQNKF
jgi:hypothetical protein